MTRAARPLLLGVALGIATFCLFVASVSQTASPPPITTSTESQLDTRVSAVEAPSSSNSMRWSEDRLRGLIASAPKAYFELTHWMFGGWNNTPLPSITVSSAVVIKSPSASPLRISAGKVTIGEESATTQHFDVICAAVPARADASNTAKVADALNDEFTTRLGSATLSGGPAPKLRKGKGAVAGSAAGSGTRNKRSSAEKRRMSNGYFGENLCVPIYGLIHGFGASLGPSPLRSIEFVTEMGTHVRDFAAARGTHAVMDAASTLLMNSSHALTALNAALVERSFAAGGAAHCTLREQLGKGHRSIVILHPVRQHFNNFYHVVIRLSATISFLMRASMKRRELGDFVDSMSHPGRNTFYSDSGSGTCGATTGRYPCQRPRHCGVKVVFSLLEPAHTLRADTAYSARRNIYRGLFQAIAPKECANGSLAGGSPAWLSTVGIPPLSPAFVAENPVHANTSFAHEVGKAINDVTHETLVAPSTSMCFDDAVIGWDKFPMHGPFTRRMGFAFKALRSAMLAYYYPMHHFQSVVAGREKENAEMATSPSIPLRVVFIIRRDSRRIINVDELLAELRLGNARETFRVTPRGTTQHRADVVVEYKVTSIEPEKMPMHEQMRAAAEADVLVGVNGAALTLGAFMHLCRPHCVLLEIVPPTAAFKGRSGWNNNRKATFGSLMDLGGHGHHLLFRLPFEARCHFVVRNGSDCITYTANNTAQELSAYPSDEVNGVVPPVPPPSIRVDVKVKLDDLRVVLRSAACLNAVRGRWAAHSGHAVGTTARDAAPRDSADEGGRSDDDTSVESRIDEASTTPAQAAQLCDIVFPYM